MPNNDAYELRLLVVGDDGVGKSSLIKEFISNHSYGQGLLTASKSITINNQTVDFNITECNKVTLKSETFDQLCTGKNACIICFDHQTKDYLSHAENWVARLRESPAKKATFILVSTKIDSPQGESSTPADIKALMIKYGINHYHTTNAITNHGITALFNTIATNHIAKEEETSLSEAELDTVYKCRNKFLNHHRTKHNKKVLSFFSRTTISNTSSLEDILHSATRADKATRSKQICIDLNWINKDGSLHDGAPQPVKDAYQNMNHGSSLSL